MRKAKMIRKYLSILFLLLFVCIGVSFANKDKEIHVPDWIRFKKALKASQIPEGDYPYLVDWLDKHSNSPGDYVIDLFKRRQVVILGEFHHIKEHKDFVLDLLPRLYHEAGVRCIGWEFSRYSDNGKLKELVTSPEFDKEATLQFARDQLAHAWNSKEHWDFIERIWRFNHGLEPDRERMRFVGLDMDLDFCRFFIISKTKAQDSPEFQEILTEVLKRDKTMSEQVEKEIIDKNQKVLVFVGRCHDFTHYEFPQEVNMGRDIMGNLLYKKYGERVFQVWLGSGWLAPMKRVMKARGHRPIGFDLYTSPFAHILSPSGWDAPEVSLSKIARGYVYLGPREMLHKNTPIKNFITDDMFERYKQYYEIDLGRTFKNAQEVDEYLQKHRFPEP
jgi:uncharacterized iron-regulated protein